MLDKITKICYKELYIKLLKHNYNLVSFNSTADKIRFDIQGERKISFIVPVKS